MADHLHRNPQVSAGGVRKRAVEGCARGSQGALRDLVFAREARAAEEAAAAAALLGLLTRLALHLGLLRGRSARRACRKLWRGAQDWLCLTPVSHFVNLWETETEREQPVLLADRL